jgi:vacuolar-type H+-ATPase subunit I/STV1
MHAKSHPAAALLAAALAAALLAPVASAQDAAMKKAPASAAKSKDKANLMTRDELRACMNEQDRLKGVRATIEQQVAVLDQQKAAVLATDAELKKKAAALDPADEAGRKALDAETAKRDEVVDAYNAKLASVKQQGQEFDTGRAAWVEKCTKKSFDEMDEAAIKKERAQAARAAAAKK